MKRLKRKIFNQPKRTKFIVTEKYGGTKSAQQIFSDIFLLEHEINSSRTWTSELKHDTIQETDNSQIACCSRKE